MQKIYFLLITFSLFLGACSDVENPPAPNEEELITTVKLTFTEVNSPTNSLTFTFSDPDGVGGNAPIKYDSIRLKPAINYSVSVAFLDESNVSDIKDLTSEIKEESNDHYICLNSTLNGAIFTYKDLDDNNLPIGLLSEFISPNSGNGVIAVSLKHQPGIKTGSCDVGETDVEVSFVAEID